MRISDWSSYRVLFRSLMIGNVPPIIMAAVGGEGIAIIQPRLDQIALIPALGPHFLLPQPPVLVEGDPQQVAMPIGPDRRMKPLRRQRIARRRASIQIQPQYLAQGRFRILRRSEEHTSELQSLMRISYAVFCLKKKKKTNTLTQ